jgi:hypothetical protein
MGGSVVGVAVPQVQLPGAGAASFEVGGSPSGVEAWRSRSRTLLCLVEGGEPAGPGAVIAAKALA